MSYTEALSRVAEIQGEVAALTGAAAQAGAARSESAKAQNFAEALARAQASAAGAQSPGTSGTYPSGYGLPSPAVTGTASLGAQAGAYGAAGLSTESLPPGAQQLLTGAQQTFASRLSSLTGLDPRVVSAWLLAEESGEAAKSREAAGNNDWLNIGYTDSATYGSSDSVWSNPQSAAEATAGWLKGQNTIPGYGTASSGIQAIAATAGSTPEAQIAAIQGSGWASSGYPDLPGLYQQVSA